MKQIRKHFNIPIFIPHLGCPNACVFCDQRSISGKTEFQRERVEREIEEALSTLPVGSEAEIAYFGGSFTGIDRELMIYLLDVAKRFTEEKREGCAVVVGIRMSTRPDYIDEEILEILSRYPVKTVELGLQSMDDGVLALSKRGHTSADAERACRLILQAGFSLVGQMMIGLPGSTLEKEKETARRICEMGACAVRIYPTVTFRGTALAQMAQDGRYQMLETEDAILRAKEVLRVFEERGVECIRLGLCASDNLGDPEKVMGGANHPALGELVMGELYYDKMRALLKERCARACPEGKSVAFLVPRGDISKAIGQGGKNRARLLEEFSLSRLTVKEHDLPEIILADKE